MSVEVSVMEGCRIHGCLRYLTVIHTTADQRFTGVEHGAAHETAALRRKTARWVRGLGQAVNNFESTWHMRNGKWTPCCFTRFQARLGTIQSTKFAGIKWKRMLSKRMNRYLTGFVRLTSFLGLLNWIMLSFKLFRGPAMQNRPFIRQCLILAKWSKVLPSGCYKFPCKIVKRIWCYIIQLKKPLTLQLVIFFCSHDLFARLWSENVMRGYILSTFEVFRVNSQISCHSPHDEWLAAFNENEAESKFSAHLPSKPCFLCSSSTDGSTEVAEEKKTNAVSCSNLQALL